MNIGMLWYDASKDALAEKVRRAAAHHLRKYGRKPELCLVHSGVEIAKSEREIDGVIVRHWGGVLRNHLWIGIDEWGEEENADGRARNAEVPV